MLELIFGASIFGFDILLRDLLRSGSFEFFCDVVGIFVLSLESVYSEVRILARPSSFGLGFLTEVGAVCL